MELLKAQITKGASFITDWTRPSPSHREDRIDDGPFGRELQLEPVFSNPFGPRLKQNTPILVGQRLAFSNLLIRRQNVPSMKKAQGRQKEGQLSPMEKQSVGEVRP
ncbi:hypothetical protein Pyn_06259 [Prunus yedoensis var. nudiflora]|uniref:Uncharacterized protein n=1 Tax=Prunus yedoensis var. nudiflora TaxID=2094558 RepID=A0A314YSR5_PRUYE|nr:hypothetical protein Pyn_06259 [Prunus yedoensis var. nudiflora]